MYGEDEYKRESSEDVLALGVSQGHWWLSDSFFKCINHWLNVCLPGCTTLHMPGDVPKEEVGKGEGESCLQPGIVICLLWTEQLIYLWGFAFTQVHPVHLLILLVINRIVSRFTPQLVGKVCTWVAPEDRKYLIISNTYLAHLPRCAVLQIIKQATSQREVQAHPSCGLQLYSSIS